MFNNYNELSSEAQPIRIISRSLITNYDKGPPTIYGGNAMWNKYIEFFSEGSYTVSDDLNVSYCTHVVH